MKHTFLVWILSPSHHEDTEKCVFQYSPHDIPGENFSRTPNHLSVLKNWPAFSSDAQLYNSLFSPQILMFNCDNYIGYHHWSIYFIIFFWLYYFIGTSDIEPYWYTGVK